VSLSPISEFEKDFTMPITSIFGIQSGFDSASLVEKLIALEARPIDLKLAQLEAKETELEAFQSLRTQLQSFQSTLQKMNTPGRFSSNTANFTVTAGTGNVLNASTTSSASVGTYDIDVFTLANATTLLSDTGFAATDTLQDVMAGAGGYGVDISIGGSPIPRISLNATDTVQDVVVTINASGLDVTASVIDDGSATDPFKIVIQGNTVGTANAVTAEINRPGGGGGGTNPISFTPTPTGVATDASLTVDGVPYTRTTNAISDIITGVTLDLESIGSGTLVIASETAEITANIEDFVNAFNTLIGFIDEQMEFNPETFATGTLFGNSAVQGLETTLRRIATGQVTGGSNFEFLSQIGITTQNDGTLFLDEAKLNNALTTDLTNVVELFTSANGVITQLDNQISVLLDSSQQGPLTSELDSLTGSIDDLNDTLLRMDERLELFERNIRQEFINLEIILGKLDAQRNAFQQALQNLNGFFDRQS
jgi:flagellar hook-associated protein 2